MAFYNYFLRIEANSQTEANEKMEKFIKIVSEHKPNRFISFLNEVVVPALVEIKKYKEREDMLNKSKI